jgi:hypothetical protein
MDDEIEVSSNDDRPEPSPARGRVIEFYIPATFRLPERPWVPPEARGKLIEFPTRGVRKSA